MEALLRCGWSRRDPSYRRSHNWQLLSRNSQASKAARISDAIAMTHPSVVQIGIGIFSFLAAVVWIGAEIEILLKKIHGWVNRPRGTHVDATINQMYGDVHVEREYAGTRNAKQQVKGRK
jgi:hypothetical protein